MLVWEIIQTQSVNVGTLGDIISTANLLKDIKDKGKAITVQRVPGGWGSQVSRHLAHEGGKVVSPIHWLSLPPGNFFISIRGWMSQLQGHSAARNIMSMINSNDTAKNHTCNLLACSAVPQPSVALRALVERYKLHCITIHSFLDAGFDIILVLIVHIVSIVTYSRSGGISTSY